MTALTRTHDWEKTPLGSPEGWPQSLRTVVNIVLTSRYAMWLGWGDALTFFYNDAYRPTLGLKHPNALGAPASEVWAEIWKEIGPRIQTVLSTGEATYDEGLLLFLERSGFREETYHTFSYSPLTDDDGRVSGMLCVVTEETERVINERRMSTLRSFSVALSAASEEREVLQAVEQQLGTNTRDLPFTLTYLFEEDGSARLAATTGMAGGHPAALMRIGPGTDVPWPAEEMLHHPATQIAKDLRGTWERDALPTGAWNISPERAAIVPIKKQGHEHSAGFVVIGLNPYQRYDDAYRGFIELVTGQMEAGLSNAWAYQEERRRAEALTQLDRAKTTFFSNVSHEFRTPLTLMLGPVEDLLSRMETDGDRGNRELLEVVHRSGLRLQRLVNSLLDFSRIEAGRAQAHYQEVDLSAVTADLASSFRSAMERAGLKFTVDCEPLTRPIYLDAEMWEKVVLNLVSNAFKYTLSGSVEVRVRDGASGPEFSVKDTGTGIPEEELPRLFERFYRVEQTRGRTHEGTGIGLALVQELVSLHGGQVSATSAPGRGSTFTVRLRYGSGHLPAERVTPGRREESRASHVGGYLEEALRWLPEAAQEAAAEAASGPGAAPAGRVLLVDDNADMRDYVRRLLSTKYEVTTAANGREALESALSQPPDLVLSDVMMPELDGFGLLKALRENQATRTVPVILLSARAGEEASVEGLKAGADDYLVKPFTRRELMARVESHLALRRERQRANDRLGQVFLQAPVGIIVFRGRDFVVELANPVYREMLHGRELMGRRFAEVVPELEPHVWEALFSVLDTGEAFVANDFPVRFDHDGDGLAENHWFNVVYQPLEEQDGSVSGVICVCMEVTEQMRARQELERVNRELEEFAYVSSHDLQEPLRMVSIYSQLLLRRVLTEDAAAAEYAGFVRQGVRRMEELIQDLLTYSRIVHPEQEPAAPADLNLALDEALKVLQMRVQETGASISHPMLPLVLGEERQLALVFQNLIANAMKYRPADVVPRIAVTVEDGGAEWVVRVADNGIGFDPDHAERIFGLFKRLHKDAYPGTGLGLAICKRIVERYGGRVWAESEGDAQGAVFSFSLRKAGEAQV